MTVATTSCCSNAKNWHRTGISGAIVAERAALVQSNMTATAPEVIVIE
ncbi:hypothetical protein [Candidatus Cryosericum odellii]|nr:hypothetical protein [Candidatus Cryosericum odellii]